MRSGSGWADTSIVNVSTRGMGLRSLRAPIPGAYIEVRKGDICIVAQVVWTHGQRFGVRTRDDVDLRALSTEPSSRDRCRTEDGVLESASPEWKRIPKRHSEISERNRFLGRSVEFAFLGFGAAAASLLVAQSMNQTLSTAAARIVEGMNRATSP